jgi:hypothetical protein
MMSNFQFRALTMNDAHPMSSDHVVLLPRPELHGDEAPARKAMAWAAENTGAEKELVAKQIERELA